MTTNGTNGLSPEVVVDAVKSAINRLPVDVQTMLVLSPVPAGVRHSTEGDWVVPVASGASIAVNKSYELHRVLSQIQHEVEKQVKAFVSITLEP